MPTETKMNFARIRELEPAQNVVEHNKFGHIFNEKTFYPALIKDIQNAKQEIIIHSPFVTKFRIDFFRQTFEKLKEYNTEIFIFTRPLEEYDRILQKQALKALRALEELGVCVFYISGSIHEKVAIIDRKILWEGSLNILSQRSSREMMRRFVDEYSAREVMSHLDLPRKLAEGYKQKYEKLLKQLKVSEINRTRLKFRLFPYFLVILLSAYLLIHYLIPSIASHPLTLNTLSPNLIKWFYSVGL